MAINTAIIKATTIGRSTRVQTADDPARVIRRGWDVYPLPKLHELTHLAIANLSATVAGELRGREPSKMDVSECSPVAAALEACCAELREESGMPLAQAARQGHSRLVRRYIEQQPAAWLDAFNEALGEYRRAAAAALEAVFARSAAAA